MALRIADSQPPASAAEEREAGYRARRAAIEGSLGRAGATAARDLPALFAGVAREALAGLAAEPREPVLLNYAGVGLYELGAREAAAELFGAALRLDPELPHAADNLAQSRRRAPAPKLPAGVAAALPALEREGRAAAARGVPATGLKLSLCMIVKDEAEMLPRSLGAAAGAVDEIVVVDTGSSDDSVAIARSFGATVIEREWTGSFAEARNASFDAAGGDWILYLDADEVLVAEDAPLLRELTGRTWREAFYLVETNHTGELGDGTAVTHNALRLFRNRPEYRFEGRLHEQIAHRLPAGLPERLELTPIRVDHYGYLGAVRDAKEKSRRNIELLRRQLAESGETAFLCFNLGSELAAAGDAEAAREQFERAWELLEGDPQRAQLGYLPSLTTRLVKSLRVCGYRERAAQRAEEGLALFPELTDLVFEQALLARAAGDAGAAAALLEECLDRGDAPSRHSPTVGCGSYLALVRLAEVERERGEEDRAEQLLDRCLREHPRYLGSVLPLCQALLRRGAAPEEVVARIEEGVEEMTPSVRFMTATALYEAGHPETAEPLFRAVVAAQPDNGSARLALAETLLSLSDFGAAAVEAAAVGDEDPAAPAAARSELFARVLAGEVAAEAWERAARRGLGAAELALFRAWAAGDSYPGLDPDLVEPLATMLEALLRIEQFEAFEALLPALAATGLEPRARAQLLAETYLRRGFLESAAEEWIAAVERFGPDPAALTGLAHVAAARGLAEDAQVFAEQAGELASSSG
ncbi:MAG TPA: glycosyltransferase family 2 protein [Solirubrobacterales bacterium]|nr:glycosyltransferase family 2 protein [Solirubrobacterales bacterium]